MFWLFLFYQSILYFLIFPLKLILTLIAYFMWNPPFKVYEAIFEEGELRKDFKIRLLPHGDNGKFESIYAVVKGEKDRIFKFIDDNFNFTRFYGNKNWSGDMMAGWLFAFTYFLKNNQLNEDDVIKFKKAVENAFFNKPYFQFGNKYDNRGFLFRWWFLGSDFIVPLATLWIYNHLFNNWKTKFLYYYFLLISLPLFYFYPNPSIATKRFYWVSWYSIHSKTLLSIAILMIKKNFIAERILKFSYKRYGEVNPEIRALYCNYYGWNKKDKDFVEMFLRDYTDKRKVENIEWIEVKHIKDILKRRKKKIKISKYILPSRCRRNQYNWEKSLVNPYYETESYLAYYHLLFLYDGGLKSVFDK